MLVRILSLGFHLLFVSVFFFLIFGLGALYYLGKDLPDHQDLANYQPPVLTRVHAGDGRLLNEYASERRVFVPIEVIPRHIILAFLSAEDKNFYQHFGINPLSIFRAIATNIRNIFTGRRLIGASTITQQVAKNFLLGNELSFRRKVREAILALRLEQALSKDRILELYLNEIYLGASSYGIAAAAANYFHTSLDEITLSQAAFLASLPKAPNNYNPKVYPQAALKRRNWVLHRMWDNGHISTYAYDLALSKPLETAGFRQVSSIYAPYFSEQIRRRLVALYGREKAYGGGLSIRTSLRPDLQEWAQKSLRKGLLAYDLRQGFRGASVRLEGEITSARLAEIESATPIHGWRLAGVEKVSAKRAELLFPDGSRGLLEQKDIAWSHQALSLGEKKIVSVAQVLSVGDGVWVEQKEGRNLLRQIPQVNGALIALDPHTGRVFSLVGGFSFSLSEFDRATQAKRQPGSAFKPFVYMAALDNGYTPATIILDAPLVIDQGPGQKVWKPANYSRRFYGPSLMRVGIENSRNLMTIRLAQEIGMGKVREYAQRFGIVEDMPEYLSMSLGAGETTLLRMVTAYAMIVNGGKHVSPSLIDRVQDRHGRTIHRKDDRVCHRCRATSWQGQRIPSLPDLRKQVVSPETAYQMVSMLRGVVERGTGIRLRSLGRPLAGKTGTTNESKDTWFLGFTPDLVVGVYVGFDQPKSLGEKESGSSVALPIVKDFFRQALKTEPMVPFRIPPGIRLMRIDSQTGLPPQGEPLGKVYLEAFQKDNIPKIPFRIYGKNFSAQSLHPQSGQEPLQKSSVDGLY